MPQETLDATDLKSELRSLVPPIVLDVRWALGDSDGRRHYRDAHIPGAVFVDLENELAEPASLEGRHPLPSIERLQAAARRWGVTTGVPGAISAPTSANLDADGRFLSAEALRERFRGVKPQVGVYCGSGITAAHQVAALAIAGIDAALYPGSWSQWSGDPARPVATGM